MGVLKKPEREKRKKNFGENVGKMKVKCILMMSLDNVPKNLGARLEHKLVRGKRKISIQKRIMQRL